MSLSPLAAADYEVLGTMRCRIRRFWNPSELEARKLGIPPQQHQALLVIAGHSGPDDITISELTQCLALKIHTVVELVSRLVQANLVSRRPSPADARRVLIRLTDDAREYLEGLAPHHRRELESLEPLLRDLLHDITQRRAERGA